jgi:hypothetical protein
MWHYLYRKFNRLILRQLTRHLSDNSLTTGITSHA